jgi:hypothetical protein
MWVWVTLSCTSRRDAAHAYSAAFTIATMPAFTALGRCSQASITVRRSSGMSPIHMPYSSRTDMSWGRPDMVFFCASIAELVSASVGFCMGCVLNMLPVCPLVSAALGGSNPPFGTISVEMTKNQGSSPSFGSGLSSCTISQYPFFSVVFISQPKGPALNQLINPQRKFFITRTSALRHELTLSV